MSKQTYLVALGSNMRHPRLGAPRAVLRAAMEALDSEAGDVVACSPIITSAPIGPSIRRYANAAVVVQSASDPRAMLAALHRIEEDCGRERRGQRWRARVLDLDIVLWDGGIWADRDLLIPHRLFRTRDFVLGPAAQICPNWRDPLTGLSLRQLFARLTRPRPLPR